MATTLFKLAITAETTTTVSTRPVVERYFYKFDSQHLEDGVLTIPANAFVDDQGDPVSSITLITANNGYYNLFINGVLQQEGLYTVSETQVVIQDAADIKKDTPIILIVTNFDPEAQSTTTVTT